MIKPIKPAEARSSKKIPEFVIEAVNELIQERVTPAGGFTILQKDIVHRIKIAMDAEQQGSSEYFDVHWLDFEDLYREAGWVVTYDGPGYNESYEANFYFCEKAKR